LATSCVPSLAYRSRRSALTRELAQLQFDQAVIQSQTDTNKAEAANASVFVSGGRPFIMWICGFSLAWSFILEPMGEFFARLAGVTIAFPALDTGQLMPILMGMLGLSASRTYEKLKGVNGNHG
jgi:hypothetical protein